MKFHTPKQNTFNQKPRRNISFLDQCCLNAVNTKGFTICNIYLNRGYSQAFNISGLTTLPNAIVIIASSTTPCIPEQTRIQGHTVHLLRAMILFGFHPSKESVNSFQHVHELFNSYIKRQTQDILFNSCSNIAIRSRELLNRDFAIWVEQPIQADMTEHKTTMQEHLPDIKSDDGALASAFQVGGSMWV